MAAHHPVGAREYAHQFEDEYVLAAPRPRDVRRVTAAVERELVDIVRDERLPEINDHDHLRGRNRFGDFHPAGPCAARPGPLRCRTLAARDRTKRPRCTRLSVVAWPFRPAAKVVDEREDPLG